MSNGIQVGQVVWFDKPKYDRGGSELMELPVKKVGRKFFYLGTDHWKEYRIDINTLHEVEPDSNHNGKVYLMREEWEQERELNRLQSVVSSYFRKGEKRLPAQALAQIEYIIEQYPHP